jgi:phytol kinase
VSMRLAVATAAIAALPVTVQLLSRRLPVDPEVLRKLVHIGGALLAVPLPLVLPYRQIVALGVIFAVVMAVSRRARVFTAVHDVERATYGEILFPLGVAFLAALFPHPLPFVYGVLVLGLADGLAAIVGTRYGRLRIPGGKSVVGSATFFGVSCATGLALLGSPAAAVSTAAALTAVEATLRGGLDNIVVPGVAGLLVTVL